LVEKKVVKMVEKKADLKVVQLVVYSAEKLVSAKDF
jgi:hypothetical protein